MDAAMNWKKIGRVFDPEIASGRPSWMQSHAMLPIADHLEGDLFRIYFCGRDQQNRSLVGYLLINLNEPTRILDISQNPVLGLGDLGCFDDNGVSPSWIVNDGQEKYLFYIGWKPRSTTRMSVQAGAAVSRDGGITFQRLSRATILPCTDQEPIAILTAPCVFKEGDRWRLWYVSGLRWDHPDLVHYNIKYAESRNGIDWKREGRVCIASGSENESSLARPCVFKDGNLYHMWYSYKKPGGHYRMGYAQSEDGLHWRRMDDQIGIDVSKSGWDSEMVEYAYVFRHGGQRYMLYNGNNYGATGFGLAVAE
ncbi:MAG: hypothetical protein HQL81_07005 [Magnetococcales bacterium]|nr:hypothetical protein [Magnetococcales bacterium]